MSVFLFGLFGFEFYHLQGLSVKTPRGLGFFFRLASTENSGKKPHPLSCFFKSKVFLYSWQKKELGVVFFFSVSLSSNNGKKNPPPGGFHEKPLYVLPPQLRKQFCNDSASVLGAFYITPFRVEVTGRPPVLP